MISIKFLYDEKGKELLFSTLSKQGWKIIIDKSIEYGTKYLAIKADTKCRFVLYQSKNKSYSKIVVEKCTDEFEQVLGCAVQSVNEAFGDPNSKDNKQPIKKSNQREIKEIPAFKIRIGSDETGKGDYFGPVIVAGVCLYKEDEESLKNLGISDSKAHTDSQNLKFKNIITGILGEKKYSFKILSPQEYNKEYKKVGNINKILAKMHGEVIKDLLTKNPECKNVIIDQFAEENLMCEELKGNIKKGIHLFQTPKGERDLSVASASMIARGLLVEEFNKMMQKAGIEIPFGAGNNVIKTAQTLVKKIMVEKLSEFCKINFSTTDEVYKF